MTRIVLFIISIVSTNIFGDAQSYNQEKTALTNFLVRMYESAPFDGVKAVEDYENAYLMSVVKGDSSRTANGEPRMDFRW